MVKKPLLFLFILSILNLSAAWAADYTVEAANSNPNMLSHYRLLDTYLSVNKQGTPQVVVETQGDCRTEYVWRCYTYSHGDHHYPYDENEYSHLEGHHGIHHGNGHNHHDGYHYHEHCGYEPQTYCSYQKGHFPLDNDQIIFDGNKRVKFIGDGNYQTIGRSNRKWYKLWLGRNWEFNENVKVHVANDYSKVTLDITVDR